MSSSFLSKDFAGPPPTACLAASCRHKSVVCGTARLIVHVDEPDEVEVVEHQLTEHLDLDPVITLGVLCDQIIPPDEPSDEEDQAIRDNLRSLVLNFMVGRAKRAIVDRHASVYNSEGEKELVRGMHRVRYSSLATPSR